jgi:hypothetical protein
MPANNTAGPGTDQSSSNLPGLEPIVATCAENKPSNASTEPQRTEMEIAVIKLSDIRAPELTEQEIAEERRRLKEIRAGRHPDTGKRLKPSDRKTLKPMEVFELQNQHYAGAQFLDPYYRCMMELKSASAQTVCRCTGRRISPTRLVLVRTWSMLRSVTQQLSLLGKLNLTASAVSSIRCLIQIS